MRQVYSDEGRRLLEEMSSLIKDFTDFGLSIWELRLNRYSNETIDLPSNLLFRQILEMGDAIFELVQKGCINASKPLLRSAVEYYFQLAYILKSETERKSLFFLYHYNKSKLSHLERLLNENNPNSLSTKLKNDRIIKDVILSDSDKEAARKDYESILESISSEVYSEIRKEYGEKKLSKWFQVLVRSQKIEDLAIALEESGLYEILYRDLSSFIHGEDILHSNWVSISEETVGLKALRDISQVKEVVDYIIIIMERATIFFIQNRLDSDKSTLLNFKPLMDKAQNLRGRKIIFKEENT